MNGFVLWFDPVKCFGFIRPEDGDGARETHVFFHASVVQGSLNRMLPGTPVTVDVIPDGGKRRRAIRVVPEGEIQRTRCQCPQCGAVFAWTEAVPA